MPELPEVEVVRRGLAGSVVGRRVASVTVLHPRAVRRHVAGAADFAARLTGCLLGTPRRRGKYLWLPTGPDEALVAHLGMSGQMLLRTSGAPDEAHLRVRLAFDDEGPELRFVDQRTFGGLSLAHLDADGVPTSVRHIAPDPFDPLFDEAGFAAALARRRTGVKRLLLDQTVASGIGNIYADEALWRARIHAERPAAELSDREVTALLAAVRTVMSEALAQGGTSFDALYVDVDGRGGYFDRSLAVYGREGLPCRRCGSPVRRTPFANRSSFWCPTCQPAPRLTGG